MNFKSEFYFHLVLNRSDNLGGFMLRWSATGTKGIHFRRRAHLLSLSNLVNLVPELYPNLISSMNSLMKSLPAVCINYIFNAYCFIVEVVFENRSGICMSDCLNSNSSSIDRVKRAPATVTLLHSYIVAFEIRPRKAKYCLKFCNNKHR